MTVIIAAITGFLAGRMLWIGLRQTWHRDPLLRNNYQGTSVPTAAGIVIAMTLVLVEAVRAVLGAAGIAGEEGISVIRAAAVSLILGFSLIGLLDDLVGSTKTRGFVGHMKALGRGELTSGVLKLIVGAGISLVVASMLQPDGVGQLFVNAAVIALCANLFNLLDLRPGRTTKVGIIAFVILAVVAAFDTALVPVAIVIGAAAALMLDDLHERLMLGDTGSNALGAAIGLGIVTQVGDRGAVIALIVLTGLNLLSEVISFSKIIDGIAPLRAFDKLGRRNSPTIDVRSPEEGAFMPNRPPMSPIRANVGGAHERSIHDPLSFERGAPSNSGSGFSGEEDLRSSHPFDPFDPMRDPAHREE